VSPEEIEPPTLGLEDARPGSSRCSVLPSAVLSGLASASYRMLSAQWASVSSRPAASVCRMFARRALTRPKASPSLPLWRRERPTPPRPDCHRRGRLAPTSFRGRSSPLPTSRSSSGGLPSTPFRRLLSCATHAEAGLGAGPGCSNERIGHALSQRDHDADRWVAATALRLGIPLVSNDGIFKNVPRLALETLPSG